MELRKPKNHTVIDMYKAWCLKTIKANPSYIVRSDRQSKIRGVNNLYKKEGGNEVLVMSYIMFRLIIEMYNKYAAEALIHGHRFDLGSRLGYLFAARVERSFQRPKFDVVSTVQMRKQVADHPAMYFLDTDYIMIKWWKGFRITNESVYTFTTAKHSLRAQFSQANKKNPVLKTNYRFIPLQSKQQQSA